MRNNGHINGNNTNNGFDYRNLVPLYVFGICGFFSVFMDFDHIFRCLSNPTWTCITGSGPKILHSWFGAVLSIIVGLVCTCAYGYYNYLVDESVRATNLNSKDIE